VTNVKTNESKSLLIYPNPAHQLIFIKGSGVDVRNIRIMNNLGQSKSVNSTEVEGGWRIDIADVPAGVYLLQIQTDGDILYHRVVVDN
jgi:hypothetical protein